MVGSYKKFTLSTALDWKKRAGLTMEKKNVVSRPQDVDFELEFDILSLGEIICGL